MPGTPQRSTARLKQRWHRASPAQRREMVIQAAWDILVKRGPQAITMRRVAQRLGVGAMTLYTYIHGQDELRREITRRGFDLLASGCRNHSTLDTPQGWLGGARHYIQFALDNPHLYELMFSTPMPDNASDAQLLVTGFEGLLNRVRERLQQRGLHGAELEQRAQLAAARYWIALHGLASLALAGRLRVCQADVWQLLEEMLPGIAPD